MSDDPDKPSANKPSAETGWRDSKQFERGEPYDAAASGAASGAGEPLAAGRRPPMALLIGGAAALAAVVVALWLGAPRWMALVLGGGAFALYFYSFGGAPASARRRVVETPGVDQAAVQAALDAAESDLATADTIAAGPLAGRGLSAPIREMTSAARKVLDQVAKDPGDYDRARKFLKVYLPSARATVEKYAAFEVIDADLESRFKALLTEMRETSERQRQALLADDKIDLEVEMEVLAERLKH